MTFPYNVVELDKSIHDRSAFDCETHELNEFLQKRAAANRRLGISKTLVLTHKCELSKICAYLTLANTTVDHSDLPSALAKKLPRYPVPVILIAQLAVDVNFQKKGLGSASLLSAIKYAYEANHQIPAYAVVVDALNDEVLGFYEKFGFEVLANQRKNSRPRLFLSIRKVKKLFIN